MRRRRWSAAALVAVPAALAAYLVLPDTTSRGALSHSVAGAVGSSFYASCHAARGVSWRCELMTSDASDAGILYSLTRDGGCWHGSLTRAGGMTGLPLRISGCVNRPDALRVTDHLRSLLGTGFPSDGFY